MKSAETFLKELGTWDESDSIANGQSHRPETLLDEANPLANADDEIAALAQRIESKAVALLAIREHGAKELKQKLLQKFPETEALLAVTGETVGLVAQLVDDVIAKCQENNWQSDERYVEQAVYSYCLKGHGPLKIRQKLQQACSDSAAIDAALDLEVDDWLETMREVLEKKYGDAHKPASRNEQAKRMRFMQSRGFPAEWIWKVFR